MEGERKRGGGSREGGRIRGAPALKTPTGGRSSRMCSSLPSVRTPRTPDPSSAAPTAIAAMKSRLTPSPAALPDTAATISRRLHCYHGCPSLRTCRTWRSTSRARFPPSVCRPQGVKQGPLPSSIRQAFCAGVWPKMVKHKDCSRGKSCRFKSFDGHEGKNSSCTRQRVHPRQTACLY